MADSENRQKPRSRDGRFAAGNPGGPGRPKGMPNKSTIDARQLRRRLIESWDRVDGDRKLDELAERDFKAYLRVVGSLVPKEDPPKPRADWLAEAEAVINNYAETISIESMRRLLALLASLPPDCVEMILTMVPESDQLSGAELEELLEPMLAASEAAHL